MRYKIIYLLLFVVSNIYLSCSGNPEDPTTSLIAEYTQIDFEPAWNCSGNKIAYAHANIDNDLSGIYIFNFNGTSGIQLVSLFARSPEWNPNGNKILFSQFESIFTININGDSLKQLTNSGKNYYPKFNDDGSKIAFSRDNGSGYNIMTMNSDGQKQQLIESNAIYPDWVRGSNSLLYFRPIRGNDGIQLGDTLIRYSFDNKEKNIISILEGDDHKINSYPVYAGDEIIFCSMNKSGYNYIYKVNTDGNSIVRLTDTQGYSPDYSFSNQKIIYTNRNKGNGRLWKMDKNGSNKTQLTF